MTCCCAGLADLSDYPDTAEQTLFAWVPQALQAAIGEKLLISKADYFVISRRSGFARQPAVQVRAQQLAILLVKVNACC